MNAIAIRRKATNVTLDQALLDEACALGINVSRACRSGLAREVKTARETAWCEKNADAIAGWNEYHEKHGLPFADLRMF